MLVQKSQAATDDQHKVCGMASCETRDLQREVIIQKGIDCQPAIDSGYINWDHGKGPEDQIGIPLKLEVARIEDHPIMSKSGLNGWGLWCEGLLLKGHPRADATWSLLDALDRMPGNPRRLAWSIQGRAFERDDMANKVTKSQLYHLAMTHQPVQTDSFAAMLKSLAAIEKGEFDFTGMSTTSAAPLRLENIDGGMTSVLWGDCKDHHFGPNRIFKSKRAMLEHLVKCRGYGKKQSVNMMKALMHSLLN